MSPQSISYLIFNYLLYLNDIFYFQLWQCIFTYIPIHELSLSLSLFSSWSTISPCGWGWSWTHRHFCLYLLSATVTSVFLHAQLPFSLSSPISYFSCCCNQTRGRSNIRMEAFASAHSSRACFVRVGKSWQREWEAWSHWTRSQEAEGEECCCSAHFLFLFSSVTRPKEW